MSFLLPSGTPKTTTKSNGRRATHSTSSPEANFPRRDDKDDDRPEGVVVVAVEEEKRSPPVCTVVSNTGSAPDGVVVMTFTRTVRPRPIDSRETRPGLLYPPGGRRLLLVQQQQHPPHHHGHHHHHHHAIDHNTRIRPETWEIWIAASLIWWFSLIIIIIGWRVGGPLPAHPPLRETQGRHRPPPFYRPNQAVTEATTTATWMEGAPRMTSCRAHLEELDTSTPPITCHHYTPTTTPRRGGVTFLVRHQVDWGILHRTLEEFRRECHQALSTWSQALEMILLSESSSSDQEDDPLWTQAVQDLRRAIQDRVDRLAALYDQQVTLAQQKILIPFVTTKMLPSSSSSSFPNHVHPIDVTTTPRMAVATKYSENKDASSSPVMMPLRRGTALSWVLSQQQDLPDAVPDHPPLPPSSSSPPSPPPSTPQAYDSAAQVWAHSVRDWSRAGAPIRTSLYDWCIRQLPRHGLTPATTTKVLIPGAGLGRLAWEMAQVGYQVEALEVSLSMAAAAAALLQSASFGPPAESPRWTLAPWALDAFVNEVSSERRFDTVLVPDVDNLTEQTRDLSHRLTYLVGDLTTWFEDATPGKGGATVHNTTTRPGHRPFGRDQYQAVVTCFFLDTATNILDYVRVIRRLLPPPLAGEEQGDDDATVGGLWIHVGPLQWHRNSRVPLAANELRQLMETIGFEILSWSVDAQPIEYRDHTLDSHRRSAADASVAEPPEPRSTHFDAYCPLRFVARRRH